jgi:quercetin dioxygenase-like cupin family protein
MIDLNDTRTFVPAPGSTHYKTSRASEKHPANLITRSERMSDKQTVPAPPAATLPPDDLRRKLTSARPDAGENIRHIGVVGDTYTILLTGNDTAGRFCLIDMHIPPGGGPPPHRHDFEESFTVLEGELEATFRGTNLVVRAGETINIPANAPHQFRNSSTKQVRLMCICSPAGQEEFFLEVGVPVQTRTTPPPKLDEAAQAAFKAKAQAIAPKYRTEILQKA